MNHTLRRADSLQLVDGIIISIQPHSWAGLRLKSPPAVLRVQHEVGRRITLGSPRGQESEGLHPTLCGWPNRLREAEMTVTAVTAGTQLLVMHLGAWLFFPAAQSGLGSLNTDTVPGPGHGVFWVMSFDLHTNPPKQSPFCPILYPKKHTLSGVKSAGRRRTKYLSQLIHSRVLQASPSRHTAAAPGVILQPAPAVTCDLAAGPPQISPA